MNSSTGFLREFPNVESGCSVIFDDDGRVAYAYFLDNKRKVVGDVWIYNRCEAAAEPEWTVPNLAPFANPMGYAASHENFSPTADISDIRVDWEYDCGGRLVAFIYIRNSLAAALAGGARPGWSALAAKDGPIARTMKTAPLPKSC